MLPLLDLGSIGQGDLDRRLGVLVDPAVGGRRLVEREAAAEQAVDRHPVGVEQPGGRVHDPSPVPQGGLAVGAPQAPMEAISDSRLSWNSSPRRTLAAPPW